jgi:hypothetical protein
MKVCCLKCFMCESIPARRAGVKHASPKAEPKEAIAASLLGTRGDCSLLFQIAADEEVGVVPLPVSAWRLSILLLVGKHEEVDQIALE